MQWSSNGLLALANDTNVEVFSLKLLPKGTQNLHASIMEQSQTHHDQCHNLGTHGLDWKFNPKDEIALSITLPASVHQLDWHIKSDYLLSVSPTSAKKNEVVWVHSLSKGQSQRPFAKSKSSLEKAVFHPTKPLLILMCRKSLYIYNLAKHQMVKKLLGGAQWNSSLCLHPRGDNLLVGSFDKKVMWFDLDLSNTPYKTMKYHQRAVREVKYHPTYPLFASCSDDCTSRYYTLRQCQHLPRQRLQRPHAERPDCPPQNAQGPQVHQ